MKFKKETLKSYGMKMKAAIDRYRNQFDKDESSVHVCFSAGNKKIGRVLNVSLAPINTCGNCKECKYLCYDIKANLQYGNVLNARARNTFLALNHPEIYFDEIREKLKRRRKNLYVRWHVGGEIPNFEYFCEMVAIAREFSNFKFWTYTKCYWFINMYCDKYGRAAIPENFNIMFSEWDGMPVINPYNFSVFSCKLKDGNKNHDASYFDSLYKCPGNCDICKAINRGCIGNESTYANEH